MTLLRDEGKVLDLLEEIQEGIQAEMEIKHSSDRHNNNNCKLNDDTSTCNDTTTTKMATGAANQDIITFGKIALTTAIRRIIRARVTTSMEGNNSKAVSESIKKRKVMKTKRTQCAAASITRATIAGRQSNK